MPDAQVRHDDIFSTALADHQRGGVETARDGYTRVLERDPRYFDALNLLGVIAVDRGQPDVAR